MKKFENVVLLLGRFAEKINGVLIKDIPECDPNNEHNWMGRTKKQLIERGYAASCPNIIDAWKAPYGQWKEMLDKEKIDEHTILVGLSAGAYALLRYLGESGKKIKKLILIAPSSKLILEGRTAETLFPGEEEFYSYEITSELRAQITEEVVIFVSRDDYPVILKSVELYKEMLGARVIWLEKLGHFSFLIKEVPELLEQIIK